VVAKHPVGYYFGRLQILELAAFTTASRLLHFRALQWLVHPITVRPHQIREIQVKFGRNSAETLSVYSCKGREIDCLQQENNLSTGSRQSSRISCLLQSDVKSVRLKG
jgi:hypothetical protein